MKKAFIGQNIKRQRENAGYTQEQLAEKLGVSSRTVSSWEINRTEPKMAMIEKMASYLHCLKSDIIGSDEEKKYLGDVADFISGKNEKLQVLLDTFANLNEEHKNSLVEYAQYLEGMEKGQN